MPFPDNEHSRTLDRHEHNPDAGSKRTILRYQDPNDGEWYNWNPIIQVDNDYKLRQALNEIQSTYAELVSVSSKKKSLLKFGSRTTVGTGWETLMTTQGSQVEEVLLSTNSIATVASSSSSDMGKTLGLEYHTLSGGNLTFGVQPVTLDAADGQTPVTLATSAARVSRLYNTGTTALVGNIYVYESGSRTDANTHLIIPAAEQQTQKAATSISANDYWIITNFSISVLSKTTKYAEARLEVRYIGDDFWRPISQTVAVTDTTGTVEIFKEPYIIVPPNSDVRIAVRTNTGAVDVAGGFSGYLAN